jgi:hypothetical protein
MSTDREQWIREQAEAEFPYYPQDQFDLTDPDDHRTYTRMKSDMNYKREGFIAGAKWLQSQCPSAPQGDNWISVEAENKQLREALQWLVELKDLKDRIDAADTLVDKSVSYAKRMRYAEEKPKAWGRAKDILASRSVKGGNNQNESI